MTVSTLPDRDKLRPSEITALETLCELTRFNARVTFRDWRRRAFDYYGDDKFFVDALAERGLVELVCFARGLPGETYEEFGWKVTAHGRRVLVANGGNPDITHNAWRRRPLRGTSSRQHRF